MSSLSAASVSSATIQFILFAGVAQQFMGGLDALRNGLSPLADRVRTAAGVIGSYFYPANTTCPNLSYLPEALRRTCENTQEIPFNETAPAFDFQETVNAVNGYWEAAYDTVASAASTVDQKVGENIPLMPTLLWQQIPPVVKIGGGVLFGLWLLGLWRSIQGAKVTQNVTIVVSDKNKEPTVTSSKEGTFVEVGLQSCNRPANTITLTTDELQKIISIALAAGRCGLPKQRLPKIPFNRAASAA